MRLFAFILAASAIAVSASTNVIAESGQALSLPEAISIALSNNSAIRKSRHDLEAATGLALQTRAIAIPKVRTGGNYQIQDKDRIETFPFAGSPEPGDQSWAADIRVVQSIYEGGRIRSSLRSAKLIQESAYQRHLAVIADTVTEVRVAYDDALLADQQIAVQEASVELLSKELEDTKRRFEAGTIPRFNLLRAEVEVANARPRLIRARNGYRIAKNNLANLLGYSLPSGVWENIPLKLTGSPNTNSINVDLPSSLLNALQHRPELAAARTEKNRRKEDITVARAGARPSVQLFAGYGSRNSSFTDDLSDDVTGWFAGAQANWDIFDGGFTRGRRIEATAQYDKADAEIEDLTRRIELEVRTAYSNFLEAQELIESQKKVQEQADEALRLATVRVEAGSATQLDVLSAQTALTEARTTQIQALRDYSVARARLERASGNLPVQLEDKR